MLGGYQERVELDGDGERVVVVLHVRPLLCALWVSHCGVWFSGLGFWVQGLGFRVKDVGLGFRVWGQADLPGAM